MMDKPTVASKTPFAVEVSAGKNYFWCACGQSKQQPFCDGSHKGTTFSPIKYTADSDKKIRFCGCKNTANQPLCDGSHNQIP